MLCLHNFIWDIFYSYSMSQDESSILYCYVFYTQMFHLQHEHRSRQEELQFLGSREMILKELLLENLPVQLMNHCLKLLALNTVATLARAVCRYARTHTHIPIYTGIRTHKGYQVVNKSNVCEFILQHCKSKKKKTHKKKKTKQTNKTTSQTDYQSAYFEENS